MWAREQMLSAGNLCRTLAQAFPSSAFFVSFRFYFVSFVVIFGFLLSTPKKEACWSSFQHACQS